MNKFVLFFLLNFLFLNSYSQKIRNIVVSQNTDTIYVDFEIGSSFNIYYRYFTANCFLYYSLDKGKSYSQCKNLIRPDNQEITDNINYWCYELKILYKKRIKWLYKKDLIANLNEDIEFEIRCKCNKVRDCGW